MSSSLPAPGVEIARKPGKRLRLAFEIVVAYLEVRSALRRRPIAEVLSALRAQTDGAKTARDVGLAEREARALGRAVNRALAVLPGDTRCLTQSLVLVRLLASRDVPVKLVIGSRVTPSFLAHAWVEYRDRPVSYAGDGMFDRLVEL